MKTLLLTIGTAAVLGMLLLSGLAYDMWSYARGTAVVVEDRVKEAIPPEIEIARIEGMLSDWDSRISRHRQSVTAARMNAEQLDAEIASARRRLREDGEILRSARELLEQDQDSYRIGDITYTRQEVDTDARQKVEAYERNERALRMKEQQLRGLQASVEESANRIRSAGEERDRLRHRLDMLRITADELALKNDLSSSAARPGVEKGRVARLKSAIDELNARLTVRNSLPQTAFPPSSGTSDIDYRAPNPKSTAELIGDCLGKGE